MKHTDYLYTIIGVLVIVVIYMGSMNVRRVPTLAPMMHDRSLRTVQTEDIHGAVNTMMSELQGKAGDEFDKAFIDQMTIHHKGAVAMAELALKEAKHQEIKDLARAIITAQNKEIASMKEWKERWYK